MIVAVLPLTLHARFAAARTGKPAPHGLPAPLIVSLTSFPRRYPTLHLTLLCLLRQSVRPDRIILWLAEDDVAALPRRIKAMAARGGLEIRTCPDTGPYKKIVPALAAYPDAFIATADDDLYYEPRWLEMLVSEHKRLQKKPDGSQHSPPVVAWRTHRIVLGENGLPLPYRKWALEHEIAGADVLNFATGGGGILYPPGVLGQETLNQSSFMENCAQADDIWLFWMTRMNGVTTVKLPYRFQNLHWPLSQEQALFRENLSKDKNDEKIARMIARYGWPVLAL